MQVIQPSAYWQSITSKSPLDQRLDPIMRERLRDALSYSGRSLRTQEREAASNFNQKLRKLYFKIGQQLSEQSDLKWNQ